MGKYFVGVIILFGAIFFFGCEKKLPEDQFSQKGSSAMGSSNYTEARKMYAGALKFYPKSNYSENYRKQLCESSMRLILAKPDSFKLKFEQDITKYCLANDTALVDSTLAWIKYFKSKNSEATLKTLSLKDYCLAGGVGLSRFLLNESFAILTNALKFYPDSAKNSISNDTVMCWLKYKIADNVQDTVKKLEQLKALDLMQFNLAAQYLVNRDRLREAVEIYDKAIALYPDEDSIDITIFLAGYNSENMKEPERAKGYYKLILDKYPKSYWAKFAKFMIENIDKPIDEIKFLKNDPKKVAKKK
jgi:tetratricopeptide (TPR) repeat protein